MPLSIHGVEPRSVFRLIGNNENSASFAVGWSLEQSPHYRALLIESVFGKALNCDGLVIQLQKHAGDAGYTDIEMQSGLLFHAVLEAKVSWQLPTVDQLTRYLPRLVSSGAEHKRIISVSAADRAHAARRLPAKLGDVPIIHLSWTDLRILAIRAAKKATGFSEKLWLRQLADHLQEFTSMERKTDNNVYVVVLGDKPMLSGGTHTWIDVVEKDGRYFHPVGNNWPVQPPNYIGFRYRGALQSVHHIESFEIAEDVSQVNPLWLKTDEDHFVYKLGPAMRPARILKTGNLFMNQRVRCAIDTLLSGAFDTIRDARDETDRRFREESNGF